MKTKFLAAILLMLAFPIVALAQPDIDVSPLTHDFGDVAVGESSTVVITIANVGAHPMTVQIIAMTAGSSADFAITTDVPSVPFDLNPPYPPGHPPNSVDVEITFSPSNEGYSSGILKIDSNDPDEGTVEVSLGGLGVDSEPPPDELIQDILYFIDESVEAGDLSGSGPGNSAANRLNALKNMIEAAGDLIEDGFYEQAYDQLETVYRKCDGESPPPDFVEGAAREELELMILVLLDILEVLIA